MDATKSCKISDASISPMLNKLNVSIVTKEKCRQSYGDVIKDSNLCAIAAAGQGTCQVKNSNKYTYLAGLGSTYWQRFFGVSQSPRSHW